MNCDARTVLPHSHSPVHLADHENSRFDFAVECWFASRNFDACSKHVRGAP